jgi:hypothetical protein
MIDRDPLISESTVYSLKSWREKIARGRIAGKFIERQAGNFYKIMEIAEDTTVTQWNGNMPLTVKIKLDWKHQQEARKRFGGVFPEYVKREVKTRGTQVGRTYTWSGEQDGIKINVIVGFWREAKNGEKIDGCTIRIRQSQEIPYVSVSPSSLYASVSCPMKR